MSYYEEKTGEYRDRYLNKRIEVKSTDILKYKSLIGKSGVVVRISGSNLGVKFEHKTNKGSAYGVFWFKGREVNLIDDFNKGDGIMTGYNNIAVVNLLEDYNKKDYYFALYDEDYKGIVNGTLVVVNARGKDQRVLGRVKEIIPVENYDKTVTAQVVAVVDETNYNARLNEEVRLKEIAKKKAAIEKELEEEIAKRKTLEFYEKMAEEYSDNPRLAELVGELKELGA